VGDTEIFHLLQKVTRPRSPFQPSARSGTGSYFYRGDALVTDVAAWAPQPLDDSLACYLTRLATLAAPHGFCIQLAAGHADIGLAFFDRVRAFLDGFYRRVGAPSDFATAELFIGDYPRTPFGVHKDAGDVFCFVLEGEKRFRFWPGHLFPDKPVKFGMLDYAEHLGQSLEVNAKVGDVVFWPSSYWHVGEGNGRLSLSMSLALYHSRTSAARNLAKSFEHAMTQQFVMRSSNQEFLPLDARQPTLERKLSTDALGALRTPGFVEEIVKVEWLKRRSGFAFSPLPSVDPSAASLNRAWTVRLRSPFPILFERVDRALLVAANGYCVKVAYDRGLPAVIRAINGGATLAMRDCAQLSVNARKSVELLIEKLLLVGALAAVPTSHGGVPHVGPRRLPGRRRTPA
jgi:hypothetical protein